MKVQSTSMKFVMWSLMIVLSFLVFSCRGQQTQTSEPQQEQAAVEEARDMDPPLAKSFKTVIVHKMEAATPELQEQTQAMDECYSTVIADLGLNPRFKVVDGRTAGQAKINDGLELKMTLTGVRVVSKKARFWGGALAGSSYMNVDLDFIDAASRTMLREKEISSANNPFGAAYTSGASDTSLAADVGHIIAAYVNAVVPE